ncbi:hypothetical protein RKD29_006100 [Streptomyces tendae]|uniref:hypothetical protein n=1 Tax=Streptomyces tendae TaxID=1932 RepID=UPI003837042A
MPVVDWNGVTSSSLGAHLVFRLLIPDAEDPGTPPAEAGPRGGNPGGCGVPCRLAEGTASTTSPSAFKRLSAALADGDRVHAVLKGSAVNNDGAGPFRAEAVAALYRALPPVKA